MIPGISPWRFGIPGRATDGFGLAFPVPTNPFMNLMHPQNLLRFPMLPWRSSLVWSAGSTKPKYPNAGSIGYSEHVVRVEGSDLDWYATCLACERAAGIQLLNAYAYQD